MSRDSLKQVRADMDARFDNIERLLEQIAGSKIPAPETTQRVNAAQFKSEKASTVQRTVSELPQVDTLPDSFKVDWYEGLLKKAKDWRQKKGLEQGTVATVLLKSRRGFVPRFFQMSSKAPANAVGIIETV